MSATLPYYRRGLTSMFACQADQRVAWCAAIPEDYDPDGGAYQVVVAVHGTERRAEGYRDLFAPLTERHRCIVLAPLFPCGIEDPDDVDNYKWLAYRGIRFDELLLAIVDEAAQHYLLDRERLLMHGFSGGGHFVHRFLYLHPERVRAASIGAPGVVTLLDPEHDWWVGLRGVEERFGRAVDLAAIQQVAVQMVVGDQDLDTWEITLAPGGPHWMEGANDAGRTRIDRLQSLRASFEQAGVPVRFDLVPGAAHDGVAIARSAIEFFDAVLAQEPA